MPTPRENTSARADGVTNDPDRPPEQRVPPAPLSYSQAPFDTATYPELSPPAVARPVLASEALMDDLAPVEPARAKARMACIALGVVCLALAIAPLLLDQATTRLGFALAATLACLATFASMDRLSYARRAAALVLVGGLGLIAGVGGIGPAAAIAIAGTGSATTRVLGATVLPAALLFRAKYRAFRGARWILAAAFATALPFASHAAFTVAADEHGLAELGALISIGALGAGLFGFMGAETNAAASYTATANIFGLAADVALSSLGARNEPIALSHVIEAALAAIAFGFFAGGAALGMFQALAIRFAPAARQIDLHKPATPPEESDDRSDERASRV